MITKAKQTISSIAAVTLLFAVFLPCSESQAKSSSLAQAAAAVRKAVKANPSNAPQILADALNANSSNPDAACELTKAAVKALPKGNAALLQQTIEAALRAMPGSSDSISQCAREAATWPGADDAINQAVASAGGGGGGGAGGVLPASNPQIGLNTTSGGAVTTNSNP